MVDKVNGSSLNTIKKIECYSRCFTSRMEALFRRQFDLKKFEEYRELEVRRISGLGKETLSV